MRNLRWFWLSLLCVLSLGFGGILPAASARAAVILLDYGEDIESIAYQGVAGSNTHGGGSTWFQPFDVLEPGWAIESIGVAGRAALGSEESSVIGTVVPDVAGRPDETSPIASGSYVFSDETAWAYDDFEITLPEGRYWMMFSAGTPDTRAALRYGTMGPQGFSIRGVDGAEFVRDATTLRIAGQVIPEPGTLLLLGFGGPMLRRRIRA